MRYPLALLAVLSLGAAEPGCDETVETLHDYCYSAAFQSPELLDSLAVCDDWQATCVGDNPPGEGVFEVLGGGVPFSEETSYTLGTHRVGRPCDPTDSALYIRLDAERLGCDLTLWGVDEVQQIRPGDTRVRASMFPITEPRRYTLECWSQSVRPVFTSARLFMYSRGEAI